MCERGKAGVEKKKRRRAARCTGTGSMMPPGPVNETFHMSPPWRTNQHPAGWTDWLRTSKINTETATVKTKAGYLHRERWRCGHTLEEMQILVENRCITCFILSF